MPRGQYRRDTVQSERIEEPRSAESAPSQRAQEVRRERRLRDDGDIDRHYRLKLAIPRDIEEQAKREGKVFRWVLDQPGRLAEFHDTDWDIVPGVGQVSAGSEDSEKLVLHWKYKDWHESDERRGQANLDALDRSLEKGHIPDAPGRDLHVPASQQNRISR